jgi:hypothetical protein
MPAGEYQKTCLFQAYKNLFPAGINYYNINLDKTKKADWG